MARRERVVTITTKGRDVGKTFVLKEMDAFTAEWWAFRALSVLGNAGVSMPASALEAGMSGLASVEAATGAVKALFIVGLRMLPGIDMERLRPLLDEMNGYILYRPPGGKFPDQALMPGEMAQIEELQTILQLRADLIELHLGFSIAAFGSNSQNEPQPSPAS